MRRHLFKEVAPPVTGGGYAVQPKTQDEARRAVWQVVRAWKNRKQSESVGLI